MLNSIGVLNSIGYTFCIHFAFDRIRTCASEDTWYLEFCSEIVFKFLSITLFYTSENRHITKFLQDLLFLRRNHLGIVKNHLTPQTHSNLFLSHHDEKKNVKRRYSRSLDPFLHLKTSFFLHSVQVIVYTYFSSLVNTKTIINTLQYGRRDT